MGWKNLPSWAKGGVVGIICGILLIFISLIFSAMQGIVYAVFFPIASFISYLYPLIFGFRTGENYGLIFIFLFISAVIESFIIGALIGFVAEKIRKIRKKAN
jgi:hypothetical protein